MKHFKFLTKKKGKRTIIHLLIIIPIVNLIVPKLKNVKILNLLCVHNKYLLSLKTFA